MSILSERKKEIERFLKEHGTLKDGNNLYVLDYDELKLELYYYERFEKTVCDLKYITDLKIYDEWFKKQGNKPLINVLKAIGLGGKNRRK